jgi:hypothetical protein
VRTAEVLSVLDEQRVQRDPVLLRHHPGERLLGLFGGPGVHDAEPVRDPVDVGVDGDRGDAVAEDEDAVRRLRSDPRELEQGGEVARHDPVEAVADLDRALPDLARLHPIEAGDPDERLDLFGARRGERARVGEPSEQPGARDVGVRVARALGEDRPDEDLERILRVVPEVRASPIPGTVQCGETVQDRLPRERGRPARRHRRFPASGGRASTPGSERSGSSSYDPSARRSSPTR